MTPLLVREILVLLLVTSSVVAQDGAIRISGEIPHNEEFRKEIGSGLGL